ncbi:MAG: hypothetical protein J7647_33045 [Cyanobacteria bacterium SBLK]|nr:hypothetical protein [Cyanobacteria bacterium SBLK]
MERETNRKFRRDLIFTIWGFATGMLAICIPLSPTTGSGPLIPLAIIVGTTVSTIKIWQDKEDDRQTQQDDRLTPSTQVKLLEERVKTLETIATGSDIDLQRRLEAIEYRDRAS